MVTRYVTRWALTSGIREVSGEYTEDGRYFTARGLFVTADEAFDELSKAKSLAKQMARKKAASLRKTAEKLADPAWEPRIHRWPT